jgi:nucleotide-binding universal stress UspA family protein
MYRKILVGTDGSRTAAQAVDRAVQLAKTCGSTLTILTAGGERARELAEKEKERHADAGIEIDVATSDRDPASALLSAAEEGGFDLLVTGNKGMTGLRRFSPMGSVPSKVSHHLPCTMLIVRTT